MIEKVDKLMESAISARSIKKNESKNTKKHLLNKKQDTIIIVEEK